MMRANSPDVPLWDYMYEGIVSRERMMTDGFNRVGNDVTHINECLVNIMAEMATYKADVVESRHERFKLAKSLANADDSMRKLRSENKELRIAVGDLQRKVDALSKKLASNNASSQRSTIVPKASSSIDSKASLPMAPKVPSPSAPLSPPSRSASKAVPSQKAHVTITHSAPVHTKHIPTEEQSSEADREMIFLMRRALKAAKAKSAHVMNHEVPLPAPATSRAPLPKTQRPSAPISAPTPKSSSVHRPKSTEFVTDSNGLRYLDPPPRSHRTMHTKTSPHTDTTDEGLRWDDSEPSAISGPLTLW